MDRDETLHPSPDEFVVRLGASAEAAIAVAQRMGKVERLESEPPLCLLRTGSAATARSGWESAKRALGPDHPLFPVLYDRDNVAHYPTGEVTVRFEAVPTEPDLRRFCEGQRLRLLRRNEYAPQQVVCEATEPSGEFLPELVARLSSQPGVRSAWANTVSRYRRAGT